MSKLPAIQFYPGDWRKDPGIQALDFKTRGVWFEILLMMWESEERGKLLLNGKAMPMEALSQILGIELDEIKQIQSKLLAYGVASIDDRTGALCNRRMMRDEGLRKVRARAGSIGGSKTQAKFKQNSTPSTSTSFTTSTTKQQQLDSFESFWRAYPCRNGKRVGKKATLKRFKKIKPKEYGLLMQATENYAKSDRFKKDPERFLKDDYWRDWLTPEAFPEKPKTENPQRGELNFELGSLASDVAQKMGGKGKC